MGATFRSLTDSLLGVLFPDRCVGCGRLGSLLCASCRNAIRPYPEQGVLQPESHPALAEIKETRAAYVFEPEGPLQKAIHQFKYKPMRRMAPVLGLLLRDYFQTAPIPADALMPVPLHPHRLAERGFNQSQLLALHLSHHTGIPLLTRGIVRTRDTVRQVTLDAKSRRHNLQGAFAWTHGNAPPPRVLIIDDVLTTGATLGACAQALRGAGATEVRALVLAHSLPEWDRQQINQN